MDEEKKCQRKTAAKKIAIIESIVCVLILWVMGTEIFPLLAKTGIIHIKVSTHLTIISTFVTILACLTVWLKRGYREKKEYLPIPIIFMVFTYLLLLIASNT